MGMRIPAAGQRAAANAVSLSPPLVMRILTISDRLSLRGGLERVHLEVNRALARRGHVVDLLYSGPGEATDLWLEFVRRSAPVPCTARRRLARLPALLATLGRATAFGLGGRPDVIYAPRHTHAVHALAIATAVGGTVVCHLHSPPPRDHLMPIQRAVLRGVSRFVAVSKFTAAQWEAAGIPAHNIEVIHNGIDGRAVAPLTEEERARTKRRLGIEPTAPVVLYTGRLDPNKGIDVLLEAWKMVSPELDGARLVVVGAASEYAGEQGEALVRRWRQTCDPTTTLFLGHTPDPFPLYGAADLVVVPSVWPEPFPLVVLEAMAAGIPVIASRIGGIPEALEPTFSRHLVHPGRPEALAAKVRELIDWRVRYPRLGDECRRHVLTHFRLDHMVDRLEALLAATARNGRKPMGKGQDTRRRGHGQHGALE